MNTLSEELILKIHDFNFGSTNTWKLRFKDVIHDLNNISFFCKTHWSSNECLICYDFNEFTGELNYNDALIEFNKTVIGRRGISSNLMCNCVIDDVRVLHVNKTNYYNNFDSDDDSDYD